MRSLEQRILDVNGARVLLPEYVTVSGAALGFSELTRIIADESSHILVTGETGTGKEVLAQAVFQKSSCFKNKRISINCAELSLELAGSELFGHVKGAFTGAYKPHKGILSNCRDGIVFFDELDRMGLENQAKLLRYMETGEIRQIGSDTLDEGNPGRIIAATNKDTANTDLLLPDLRHRFDFEIKLPALNSRKSDLLWLICQPHFLGGSDGFQAVSLSAILELISHRWPGNIRDLNRLCKRLKVLKRSDTLCHQLLTQIGLRSRNHSRLPRWYGFANESLSVFEERLRDVSSIDNGTRDLIELLIAIRACGHWSDRNAEPERIPPLSLKKLEQVVLGLDLQDVKYSFKHLADCAPYIYDDAPSIDSFPCPEGTVPLAFALDVLTDYSLRFGVPKSAWAKPREAIEAFLEHARAKTRRRLCEIQVDTRIADDQFESVLSECQLDRESETYCRLKHQGLTDLKIALQHGCSRQKVQEKLQSIRKTHTTLARFISTRPKGRKRQK